MVCLRESNERKRAVAFGCVDPVGSWEFGWVKTDSKTKVAEGGVEVAEYDRMKTGPITGRIAWAFT